MVVEAEMEDPITGLATPVSARVFCHVCQMWLNGPTQWDGHKVGKKHRKSLRAQGSDRGHSHCTLAACAKSVLKPTPGNPFFRPGALRKPGHHKVLPHGRYLNGWYSAP